MTRETKAPALGADVATWARLLNHALTDERQFLESFRIQTDLADDAPEDASPWVRFLWRSWQEEMYREIQWFAKRKRPAKLRMPKARGTGASSFSIALFGFCRPLRRPGYRTLIVAQDQGEAEEHLSRLTDFYEQVDWAALKQLGIERERSNRSSIVLVFRDPKTKRFLGRSRVRVKTARAKGLGRGGGYDAIITTERPHWFEKCKRDLKGFLARLSRTPWSAHIDESSPAGLDSFYEDCLGAEKGKGGYHLFYIPAFRRPENYKRFDDEQEVHDIKTTMGEKDVYGGPLEVTHYERALAYWVSEGLEPTEAERKALSFLYWRREEIEGSCGGSVAHFCQEHSTTFEEGFQGSDRPVFKTHIAKTWMLPAQSREWTRGNLIEKKNDVIFEPHPGGLWLLDGTPAEGDIHCFGLDLASGKDKVSGTNEEADFTDLTMDEVYSGRTVAELHAHIWPHEVAAEVLKAAWYFRQRGPDQVARGIIELNMDHGACANQISNAETFWGTGLECLILIERKTRTSIGMEAFKEYGWWTTEDSKHDLLRAMHEFIDEMGKYDPAKCVLRCPWTREQIEEISRYVYIQRQGAGRVRLGAEAGHDDRVISKALALTARRILREYGEIPLSSKANPLKAMSEVARALKEMDKRLKADERKEEEAGIMPGY